MRTDHRLLRSVASHLRGSPLAATSALLVLLLVIVVAFDNPFRARLFRLYAEPTVARDALKGLGVFAPIAFVGLQALQVVVAPIPGDVTGWLGGFVFGEVIGFVYSTIGLTAGSLIAFWLGRRLGTPFVRRVVSEHVWRQVGTFVQTGGAIVCFVIFLLPGIPKDTACYLFGLSSMSFWLFAVTSTVGRMPGTWALSAQGARAGSGQYMQLLVIVGIVAVIAVPLFFFRSSILRVLARRRTSIPDSAEKAAT